MDNFDSPAMDSNIKQTEDRIIDVLGPVEPLVMRIQSLLVWEFPRRSALLFICVHLIFWFLTLTSLRFYFLLWAVCLVIFFVDTWKKKIWPEIRVPPPIPEDLDGWTPVHPRLLSVPEIAHILAQIWQSLTSFSHECRLFRRNNHKKFNICSAVFFVILLLVGRYVSGIMLSYVLVMSIMLWPGVMYHNLMKKAYLRMEPAFMWLEYNLKKQMNKAIPVLTRRARTDDDVSARRVSVDDEDLYPSMNPETIALLARAITDSEDESGTPSLPTPGVSNQPSLENSDDEETADFNLPIDRMPSYDDLDQTDDDMDITDTTSHNRTDYIPAQYDSDSESDDDTLSKDLTFPDVSEMHRESPSHSNLLSNLTSALVSQTLSSMMQSTLQRVTHVGDLSSPSSTTSHLLGSRSRITYTKTERGESLDLMDEEEQDTIEEEDESVGAEKEIEKEFDFLEDFDPGDSSS